MRRVSGPAVACARVSLTGRVGSLLRVAELFPQSIESCLANYLVLGEDEVAGIAGFMRRCLTIDPSARPTASELLEDNWLKDA
jgi:serine/threonine-protein kinase SRPK3